MGCGACAKLGKCVRNDIVNETAAKLGEYDGLSSVRRSTTRGRAGRYAPSSTASSSRRAENSPESPARRSVSCRRGGATAAFDRLNKYFSIYSMRWSLQTTGTRSTATRRTEAEAGRRRAPDDARARRKHGVAAEVHRGGPQCRSAPRQSANPKSRTNFIR